jgi:hypothetical protein
LKELFSKLRFTYHEQVTKEKFLRAITASPPLLIDPASNSALEQQLALEKTTLTTQKAELASLTSALETRGRQLAHRYQTLQSQHSTLSSLPSQISHLESQLAHLQSQYPAPDPSVPDYLTLSAAQTRVLLEEQLLLSSDLDSQISSLKTHQIPAVDLDLERLEDDLARLTASKKGAVSRAKEARARKEGGAVDEVERRGRWCRAGEAVLLDIVG